MKILLLNTSDKTGGAAIACNRLMQALKKSGMEVKLLVRDKTSDNKDVFTINSSFIKRKINFIRFAFERLFIFIRNGFNYKTLFAISIANTGTDISRHPLVKEADIIHLHWINQGFLSLKDIRKLIKSGKPIVWTMHDMWSFTGVCHYAGDCRQYKTECTHCQVLNNNCRRFFKQKKNRLTAINFVGCSNWIATEAKRSTILAEANVKNIPNPIDINIFAPADKTLSRQKFNLPSDKKLILFAAAKLSDTRKGISYFVDTCKYLVSRQLSQNIEIVFLGGKIDDELVAQIPLPTHKLGYLRTFSDIVSAYVSCDIFVIPSLEDNLPNTVMESMACGTPCVGFNTGGIPEMIDHKINGYVAEYKSAEDLAQGIIWCFNNLSLISVEARKKVEKFYNEDVVAKQYIELYSQINNKLWR